VHADDQVVVYAFNGWEADLQRRELRVDGAAIPLGGRAFDIFEVLLKAGGRLVTKTELIAQVWAGLAIEENTLQVHISALRRAFGSDRHLLKTASGRGYRLVGHWVPRQPSSATLVEADRRPARPLPRSALPQVVSDLIGRTAILERLADLASAHRLVTLTGPGGIGKTRLAIEVARRLSPAFDGDACLVELASLSDPLLVATAVASALGLGLGESDISNASLAQAIDGRQVLIVLDNCEHLIDAAASLVEAIVKGCPLASILATSVEPLRIDGEYSFRVPPLATQPPASPDPAELAALSAVQLFIARARALSADFAPRAQDLEPIAAICRHLDGMPLAIEFAAASAASLGVDVVLARLDDRFGLLTSGRRTAQPRHRSLRAMLDWSYDLLSPDEQRLLRLVSVLPAGFTREAAMAVADHLTAASIDTGIASLVGKSLLVLDDSARPVRWRMLDTTRAYAFEKLCGHGEANAAVQRLGAFLCSLFPQVTLASQARPERARMQTLARELDNVRAVLAWAFSPAGDTALGVRLTAAFVPVWLNLSLLAECNAAVERALDRLRPDSQVSARLRMQLQIALAVAILCSLGSLKRAGDLVTSALEIAEQLDDADHLLVLTYALWSFRTFLGDQRDALRAAERFAALATQQNDAVHSLISQRMLGAALHYAGDQRQSRQRLATMLAQDPTQGDQRYAIWHHFDHHVVARSIYARVLCMQGQLDQARSEAAANVEDAASTGWGLEARYPLVWAVCPIAILLGDMAVAERSLARLAEMRNGSNLAFWLASARGLEGSYLVRRGEHARAVALLGPAIESCRDTGWMRCYGHFLGVFAEALGGLGRWDEAEAALAQALEWSGRTGEAWYVPELHRTRGELLLLQVGAGAAAQAEACFLAAGEIARQQGAMFWELRAAMSLARLSLQHARGDAARSLLSPVYARFTEGFDTADLRAAKRLLEAAG